MACPGPVLVVAVFVKAPSAFALLSSRLVPFAEAVDEASRLAKSFIRLPAERKSVFSVFVCN